MGIVFIIWSYYNQTLSKNSQPQWPIIIPKFLLKTLPNKELKIKNCSSDLSDNGTSPLQ